MATAATVFRDYETDGVPASGSHKVKKSDVRQLLAGYEAIINAFTANGGLIFASKATLDSSLGYAANTMAWVLGDATVANNGIYRKIGASGAGSWTRVADLPFSFIIASDVGAGTANAIVATTSIPVSESALIWMNVFEANTASPVTVSLNGGSALTIKTNSGNDVASAGLTAGMIVLGIVSGSTFRLVSDQASAAVLAACEAARDAAEAAQAAAEAAAAGVTLPSAVALTYLRQKADLSGYETLTAQQVREDIDPDDEVLNGDGLKLTYHKARSSWHVKAFGSTLTDVGAGNAAVDTAALQSAINTGEIIDITGTTLNINAPIAVTIAGANILSQKATRVGSNAGSKIVVADDAMTKLFDVQQPNFEASGFFIECGSGNVATTLFHFERAAGSASDIDADLVDISHEGGGKFFHIYGRGLKLQNITSGNVKTCFGDLDWPASWTPNGQTNDTQETAMRGYEFRGLRMHGSAAGIRNIGANRLNLRGLIMDNVEGDIGVGVGLFVGIPGVGSKFSNFVANIGATIAGGLLDLWEGSRDATFANMSCAGIKTASVTRLNRTAIIIRASTTNPVEDLTFTNMNIGPVNRSGVSIQGFGAAKNISFIGGSWDRTNIENTIHFPIIVTESGGTFTEVTIKLTASNFKFGAELAPNFIIGGLNSAVVHAYINSGNTKPAAIPWAQSNVVVTT
jgi:hypothetical protein